MRFSLVLLAALAASCTSLPEFRHDGTEGTVLADSPSLAANVAAALDELAPLAKRYLGSAQDDPITVHVVEMRPFGACVYDDPDRTQLKRIELNRDVATDHQRRFILYHELIHWYGQGTWIDALPLYLEEGVADYLSCERIGTVEIRHAEKALPPGTSLDLGWLHTFTPYEWQKADAEQIEFVRRAGAEIVYRIGIPRLRDAASAGPLTPSDIQRLLAASGHLQGP